MDNRLSPHLLVFLRQMTFKISLQQSSSRTTQASSCNITKCWGSKSPDLYEVQGKASKPIEWQYSWQQNSGSALNKSAEQSPLCKLHSVWLAFCLIRRRPMNLRQGSFDGNIRMSAKCLGQLVHKHLTWQCRTDFVFHAANSLRLSMHICMLYACNR